MSSLQELQPAGCPYPVNVHDPEGCIIPRCLGGWLESPDCRVCPVVTVQDPVTQPPEVEVALYGQRVAIDKSRDTFTPKPGGGGRIKYETPSRIIGAAPKLVNLLQLMDRHGIQQFCADLNEPPDDEVVILTPEIDPPSASGRQSHRTSSI